MTIYAKRLMAGVIVSGAALLLAGCIVATRTVVVVTAGPIPANPTPAPPPTFSGPTPTPLSGIPQPTAPPLPGGEYASVVYVIDGDTIDVSMGGVEWRVRYIGVNTPELGESCFQEASDANRALVENQIVTLVRDVSETDRYDRLLRYVYVGDVFVNAELVQEGWAEARRYDPDTAQYDYLDSLEAAASEQNLGCWAFGVFQR